MNKKETQISQQSFLFCGAPSGAHSKIATPIDKIANI